MKSSTKARNRWAVMFIAAILLFASACSSDTGSSGKSGDKQTPSSNDQKGSDVTQAAEPMGKFEPPIKMTTGRIMYGEMPFAKGKSIDDNKWYDLYKEQLGIELTNDWVINGGDAGQAKINATIASGAIPDILRVTVQQLQNMMEADLLEDLTEAYDQYASPELKSMHQQDGGDAMKLGSINGKLYALPEMASPYNGVPLLFVRTDWLKKLSLEEPKSMADIEKIAYAFTKDDPDGNKKNDTYGLAITKDIVSLGAPMSVSGFFNGYHAYPRLWVEGADGKLAYASTLPEMKTPLAKLAQFYKDGVLDPEFGVRDQSKVSETIGAGKVGVVYGPQWTWSFLQNSVTNDPSAEWKAYAIVSQDENPALAEQGSSAGSYYVVRKGFKHPEAAVKMMNLHYYKMYMESSDRLYIQEEIDGNNVQIWQYAAVLSGEPPAKNIFLHLAIMDAIKSGDTSKLLPDQLEAYNFVKSYDEKGDMAAYVMGNIFRKGGSFDIINEAYYVNKHTKPSRFFGAPTPTMSDKGATLAQLEDEMLAQIILGKEDISSFDKFVEKWKSLGGDKITEEVNAWYKLRQ